MQFLKKQLQVNFASCSFPLDYGQNQEDLAVSRPDCSSIRYSFVLKYPDFTMAYKIRVAMTHHCYYTIFHDVTLYLKEQGGK